MDEKALHMKGADLKDVRPRENGSPNRGAKKPANSLPKILDLLAHSGSLHRQRVRCGKPNCKCVRGQLHEGYYYVYFWSPSGPWKHYVRRADVPAVRHAIAERVRERAEWRALLNGARGVVRQIVFTIREVKP